MKRFIILALALVLVAGIFTAGPVEAKKKILPGSSITTLVVGTSSVSDTSMAIDIVDYDYIAISVQIDVTSGGGAGAGLFYVEGSTDAGVWTKIPMIDFADTGMVRTDIPFASTADLQKLAVISIVGYTIADDDAFDGFFIGNYLPYEKIRLVVVDTNWNAAAGVTFNWILEK